VARPKSPANIARDDEIYARSKNGQYDLAVLARDYGITPQRVGQVIAAKDAQVYAKWRTGRYTLADVAEEYDLSMEQVGEILTKRHPAFADEEMGRSVLRSRIELLMVAIQQVIENPGWKMSPNGGPAYGPDGEPAVDTNAKIEAMRLQLAAYERAAKLDGGDRPSKRQVTWEMGEAARAAAEDLEQRRAARDREIAEDQKRKRELEVLARQAGQPVVQGEVVREIEG
jgi:hypothetical protein